MALPIDQLVIEIKAETAQLRKGLEKVNKSLKKTETQTSKVSKAFKRLGPLLAGIGLARLGGHLVTTIRKFEDLEATLQANTGNAKETAQAMDLIRTFTATTTFQVDQVTKAFLEFRRIGIRPTMEDMKGLGNVAAAQGVGIEELAQGVFRGGTTSIEMLQSMGFEAKTQGNKMTVAFGKEGFGRIEETIDKSIESLMKFVAKVGMVKFPTALEDRLNTLSGALSNLGDQTDEFMVQVGEAGLRGSLIDLARAFKTIVEGNSPLAALLGGLLSIIVNLTNGLIRLLDFALKPIIDTANLLSLAFNQLRLFALETARDMDILGLASETMDKRIESARQTVDRFQRMFAGTLYGGEKYAGGLPDGEDGGGDGGSGEGTVPMIDNLMKLQQAIKDGKIGIIEIANAQKILNTELASGSISLEQANAMFRQVLLLSGPMGKAMATIGAEVESLSSSFSDDLTNALMEGEDALESFKNFALNVVQAVISAFLEMLVIQPIVESILGAFGLSMPKGGVGGSAGGGTVQPNTPVLVGERGAEIFVPNTGGTVLNNMNSRNAMGGGGGVVINQNLNFSTGVQSTVRSEVLKLLPTISEVTKASVMDSASRGGNFAKAIRG